MKDGKIETDADIRKLPTPTKGPVRYTVAGVPGLMVTVSTKGSKAFAFRYRTRSGRRRLHTIGQCSMVRDDPDSWSIASARAEARALRKNVDSGADPTGESEALRKAPTVEELCNRFIEEHLPKKRPSTQRDIRGVINREILPAMRHIKVTDVSFIDIDALHRKITKRGKKIRANNVGSYLSKMFSLAIK